jgi:hypothetical protein
MHRTMMLSTERDHEFIADLAAERTGLRCSCSSIGLELILVAQLERGVLFILAEHAIPDDKKLDFVAHEAAECVLRCAHDRLATHVEAGVDQHRAARLGLENERSARGIVDSYRRGPSARALNNPRG